MGNTGKIVAISLLAFGCVAETAIGAVIPLSPTGNEVVCLLPEAQRRIMSFPTYDIRLDALMKDREGGGKAFGDDDSRWRVSTPLVLVWRTTDGEGGLWRIALGEDGSFANASVWWVEGFCNAMSVKRTFCGESMKGCALRVCAHEASLRGATHLPFNFDDAQGGFD